MEIDMVNYQKRYLVIYWNAISSFMFACKAWNAMRYSIVLAAILITGCCLYKTRWVENGSECVFAAGQGLAKESNIVATYWSHESHSLAGEKDAFYATSDKDGLRRFCAFVFQNKLLSEKLQRAATQAKPGKPSRGGQFTAEQRTCAQSILRRKLWKSAPCPIDCKDVLFFQDFPGLTSIPESIPKRYPSGTSMLTKSSCPQIVSTFNSTSVTWQMDDDYITRTYSWLATPSRNRRYPVVVQNCLFSSSGPIHRVHYSVVDKPTPPEKLSWKRGYWHDPVWKQAPFQPGETSELMRKHKAQMAIWRGATLKPVIVRTFDQLVQRDEERLNHAKERSRRKRQAPLEDADDVVET